MQLCKNSWKNCPLHFSWVFFGDRSADDHSSYLAGSGADLVELGVPEVTSGRIVVDVTVSTLVKKWVYGVFVCTLLIDERLTILTQDLYRVECNFSRILGAVENHGRAIFAICVSRVAGSCNRVQIAPTCAQARVHVGNFSLRNLFIFLTGNNLFFQLR